MHFSQAVDGGDYQLPEWKPFTAGKVGMGNYSLSHAYSFLQFYAINPCCFSFACVELSTHSNFSFNIIYLSIFSSISSIFLFRNTWSWTVSPRWSLRRSLSGCSFSRRSSGIKGWKWYKASHFLFPTDAYISWLGKDNRKLCICPANFWQKIKKKKGKIKFLCLIIS